MLSKTSVFTLGAFVGIEEAFPCTPHMFTSEQFYIFKIIIAFLCDEGIQFK